MGLRNVHYKLNKEFLSIGLLSARNSILHEGKYDFDTGTYTLLLDYAYWFNYFGKNPTVPVDTQVRCTLVATFKVNEKTAKQWREAIERKEFSLTIWYRLKEITRASWDPNPHLSNRWFAHDILIEVEILKVEFIVYD